MYFRTTDRQSATDKDAAGADLWKVVEGVLLVPPPRPRVEEAVAVETGTDEEPADAVGEEDKDARFTEAVLVLILLPEDPEPWRWWADCTELDDASEGLR